MNTVYLVKRVQGIKDLDYLSAKGKKQVEWLSGYLKTEIPEGSTIHAAYSTDLTCKLFFEQLKPTIIGRSADDGFSSTGDYNVSETFYEKTPCFRKAVEEASSHTKKMIRDFPDKDILFILSGNNCVLAYANALSDELDVPIDDLKVVRKDPWDEISSQEIILLPGYHVDKIGTIKERVGLSEEEAIAFLRKHDKEPFKFPIIDNATVIKLDAAGKKSEIEVYAESDSWSYEDDGIGVNLE